MTLGRNASLGSVVGAPSRELRERRLRTLAVFIVVAVLIGTPVLSMTLFSVSDRSGTVVVEPGSYHAIHLGFYGFGKLDYSFIGVSGAQIFLVELDRRNFERLADGKSYTYAGYESISIGGSGQTTVAGMIWEEYLVLVNEESSPAVIAYEVDAKSYFNLMASGLILAIAGFVAYVVWRRSPVPEEIAARAPPTRDQLKVRRKSIVAIAVLAVVPFAIMEVIGLVVPPGAYVLYGSAFYRFYFGVLIATALAFILKFRVRAVEGEPKSVLADLAHRLRVSQFSVVEKKSMLSVRMSNYQAIKVAAKRIPEGTLVEYRADAAPSGWTVIIILLLFMFTAPFALVIALYGLYRSATFASDTVLPRLVSLSASGSAEKEPDTRAMLIDSLSEGRRLSSEAYAAARSNYEDAIIISVTIGIILSLILALFVVFFSITIAIVVGLVSGVLFSIISWRLLAKRSKPRLEELKSWGARFEVAFSRETASQNPPDGEPSAFELVTESLKEAPYWLKILGKSGMYREPGYWILIVFFCLSAFESGFGGIFCLLDGNYLGASVLLLISAVLLLSSWALYRRWKKIRDEEYRSTLGDMTARYDALKAEMENYLRDV